MASKPDLDIPPVVVHVWYGTSSGFSIAGVLYLWSLGVLPNPTEVVVIGEIFFGLGLAGHIGMTTARLWLNRMKRDRGTGGNPAP